jgi:hypothetical protein
MFLSLPSPASTGRRGEKYGEYMHEIRRARVGALRSSTNLLHILCGCNHKKAKGNLSVALIIAKTAN